MSFNMTNCHAVTGIPFGYIKADAFHPEFVDQLTIHNGTDHSYTEALAEHLDEKRREHESALEDKRIARAEIDGGTLSEEEEEDFDEDAATQKFGDSYQCDEPIYSGEHEGVHYRTSWLGGAMNFWIFESPVVVKCTQCSPCVPGAGLLDSVGNYEAYGVPADWLDDEFLRDLAMKAEFNVMPETDGTYFYQAEDSDAATGGFKDERAALEDLYNKHIRVQP